MPTPPVSPDAVAVAASVPSGPAATGYPGAIDPGNGASIAPFVEVTTFVSQSVTPAAVKTLVIIPAEPRATGYPGGYVPGNAGSTVPFVVINLSAVVSSTTAAVVPVAAIATVPGILTIDTNSVHVFADAVRVAVSVPNRAPSLNPASVSVVTTIPTPLIHIVRRHFNVSRRLQSYLKTLPSRELEGIDAIQDFSDPAYPSPRTRDANLSTSILFDKTDGTYFQWFVGSSTLEDETQLSSH